MLLYACDLKLRHNIFNKISKRRRKKREEHEKCSTEEADRRAKKESWLKWKRHDNANQTALTTTNSVTQKTKIQSHNTQWVTTEPLQYSVQTDICSKWSMQWKPWDAEVRRLESRERIVWFSRLRGGRLPSEFVFVLLFVLLLVVLLVVLYC